MVPLASELYPRDLWQGNCSPAGWEVGGRGGWWGQENNSPWSLVSEPLARDLGTGCISPWPHDHIAGGLLKGNYRWWKGVQPRIAPTGRGALEPHSTYLYGDPKNSSGLGKLFTMCINVRLNKYVSDRGIIGEEQAAFREEYSTMDHVFVLNELLNIYLHKKKRFYCCFIDYQKAFDTINRSALWGKVIENGINGKILRVIYNMYETAKSCVKQQSMISGLFACNMGVRQGENLSPLLFAIFLNDFEKSISTKYNGLATVSELSRILGTEDIEFFLNMYTLLYADDTVVLAESPAELQIALDEVGIYCKKWGLSINKTKTKVVIFSRGKVKKQFSFKIGNLDICTTSEYCYLGILFNFNGTFTKAIRELPLPEGQCSD